MRGPFQVNDCFLRSGCVQCLGHEGCSVYTGIIPCSHPVLNLPHPGPPPLTGGPFPPFSFLICPCSTAPTLRSLHTSHPLPTELLDPACYIQTGICCLRAVTISRPRTWFLFQCAAHSGSLAPWSLSPKEIPACPKPSFIPHRPPRGTAAW